MDAENRDTKDNGTSSRNWTRREVLVAGGAALLGVAGCGTESGSSSQMPHPTVASRVTATSSALQTPTPVPETPITLAFTGDVMFGRTVNSHMLTTAVSDPYPFTYTGEFLRGFDLTIGNLECVISRLGVPVPKSYNFRGDPRAYDRMRRAGFDLVSVANNHSGDYGKAAFLDELQTLPQYGLTPVGGGQNRKQAHTPVYKTVRGTTVAFLAYDQIDPYSFVATDTTPGNAWLDDVSLRQDM